MKICLAKKKHPIKAIPNTTSALMQRIRMLCRRAIDLYSAGFASGVVLVCALAWFSTNRTDQIEPS